MGRHRTPEEKADLGARARAMRREGRSRREIIAELRITDGLLGELTRETSPPDPQLRARAKDHLRAKAIELRKQGRTYPQIAQELGVSKSTCSLWLRDLEHPTASLEGQARRTAAIRASAARTQELREVEREAVKTEVARSVGFVTSRDLMLALAMSYWCEGSKDKPWSRREHVSWMNSDPMLVRLFLEGLRQLDIPDERIRLRLQIHETADECAARLWWSEQLPWPIDLFQRSTIKRHTPKTVRKNNEEQYHGCLVVKVLQSRTLYIVLDGLMRGLATQPRLIEDDGTMEPDTVAM